MLRAHRQFSNMSQEALGAVLGYDKTYISMIETGRRVIRDIDTRRHICDALDIPAHLLGVTDTDSSDFAAMLSFAESTIRLAEVARAAGLAAEAVNELWPLVRRLEASPAAVHHEPSILSVLAQAWTSLGVSLGTVLPEGRLWVATRWTAKGLAATRQLDAAPAQLNGALQMHGNELRKAGRHRDAVAALSEALATAAGARDRGAALALLARAAGDVGDGGLFRRAAADYRALGDDQAFSGPLCNPFTWREIQMRAMHTIGDHRGARRLAYETASRPAPAPQWQAIERITTAEVLITAGDHDPAEALLLEGLDTAQKHRLPHQIQRALRIARRSQRGHLIQVAEAALAQSVML